MHDFKEGDEVEYEPMNNGPISRGVVKATWPDCVVVDWGDDLPTPISPDLISRVD